MVGRGGGDLVVYLTTPFSTSDYTALNKNVTSE